MLYLLENGMLIQCYDSDNPAYTVPNGCCEGYNLFNPDGTYNDGGEYDFDPDKVKSENSLMNQVIKYAADSKTNLKKKLLKKTCDCAYEDIVELFENEFYPLELLKLKKKITNDILKAKIQKAYKNLITPTH